MATGFNPRPTRVSGDTERPARCRAPWRRFNPRPTRVSGDTLSQKAADYLKQLVSIRARHACRAIPFSPLISRTSILFQSAPDTRVGRYERDPAQIHKLLMFQSAPDTRVGRYMERLQASYGQLLFQSAPDTRVGRYGHAPIAQAP